MTAPAAAVAQRVFPNPLLPGFNPDPSVLRVGDDFYIVTSTFEYLPGLPVYHSTDFVQWELIGTVITRDAQAGLAEVPTGGGVWAPTIRHRDGVFHVIVTIAMGRGCIVYTATDPAGPWSDGTPLPGVTGIDPDLAWDDDGTAVVTFSGLQTTGDDLGAHHGIQQVRVDLATGRTLEEPRSLWSGTGLKFPEAPHLYRRGDYWYLLIAEGGTERGHAVSVARSDSPYGPFDPHPGNPVLSARSTSRPIQNTGHGDLVETPDGGTALVLLGMRPLGMTQAFSALGRETFATPVTWVDGWPIVEPVELRPASPSLDYDIVFGPEGERDGGSEGERRLDDGWLAVRREPSTFTRFDTAGRLVLDGSGRGLDDPTPAFLGRRQVTPFADFSATIDVTAGTGGVAVRYDEHDHVSVEASATPDGVRVVARYRLALLEQTWEAELPPGDVALAIEGVAPPAGFGPAAMTSDHLVLRASAGGVDVTLATVDGRYLSAETTASFTGRVQGVYARDGEVAVAAVHYRGTEQGIDE
ncbi:family 43 glycosylhydrolase [Leifsonia sp. NPDC058194]|uniref:glycoside hydrolase family 43 protein n=1 Tax=Leifsonia sp. NPDC058194 TaxID=3346374 RepID=UPI0036DD1D28